MFTTGDCVVIVLDVQGKLSQIVYENDRLIRSLEILIQGMTALGVPFLWLEQTPSKMGPTRDRIAKLLSKSTSPISKDHFSACQEPKAFAALEALHRKQVLLTGIETHICVHQTCCDLIGRGYDVQIPVDCVSSRTKENYKIGLQRMTQAGAKVTCVEMILFELMQKSEGDVFRNIAKLIK